MKVVNLASATLAAASFVHGQYVWTEPTSNVTFKIAIPEAAAAPFDLALSIIAPVATGWAGFSTGGCMLRSPLLVAWKNGDGVTVSPRWASAYHPPQLYNGTTAAVYSGSTANETHWVANILCTGCSSWTGFSLDPKGNVTFGWGVSSKAVDPPSDPAAAIHFHDIGKSHFEVDLNNARLAKDDFDALLKSFGDAPKSSEQSCTR